MPWVIGYFRQRAGQLADLSINSFHVLSTGIISLEVVCIREFPLISNDFTTLLHLWIPPRIHGTLVVYRISVRYGSVILRGEKMVALKRISMDEIPS